MNKIVLISKSNIPTPKFYELISDSNIDPICYSEEQTYIGQLTEFAGRVCYNSGFKGQKNRPSSEYHKHIIESNHLSIYGHINFTLHLEVVNTSYFFNFLRYFLFNYSRIYFKTMEFNKVFFNLSLRHIIEILKNKENHNIYDMLVLNVLLRDENLKKFLSIVFGEDKLNKFISSNFYETAFDFLTLESDKFEWYTFYISTSRRIANELLRHNTQFAISQESTRYVSQADFKFQYKDTLGVLNAEDVSMYYQTVNSFYKKYLENNNLEGRNTENRKHLLGTLANFLPLGLQTKLVVSYTRWQLEQIFVQRISKYADPEMYDLALKLKSEIDS